jgi:hypothetical protein
MLSDHKPNGLFGLSTALNTSANNMKLVDTNATPMSQLMQRLNHITPSPYATLGRRTASGGTLDQGVLPNEFQMNDGI